MIIRQLKQYQYDYLVKQLINKAQQNPLEACYNVKMTVDKAEYSIRLQPEAHCKVAILQALKVERDEYGHLHELVTSGGLLSALLELLIKQGVA